MNFVRKAALLVGCVAVASFAITSAASASSLSATYYVITENAPDVSAFIGGPGLLAPTLGPDGLPMVNSSGASVYQMVNSNNELEWWTPTTGTGTSGAWSVSSFTTNPFLPTSITLPYSNSCMYSNTSASSCGNDLNDYLTAEYQGTFTTSAPTTFTFNACSDDDEYVYIDDQLVVDNGGVHGVSCVSNISITVATAGSHTLDVFYADRDQSGAALELDFSSLTINPPPTSATPEPGTISLISLGVLGLVGKIRKQFS
jgi:fibro-slime domain-containing protein